MAVHRPRPVQLASALVAAVASLVFGGCGEKATENQLEPIAVVADVVVSVVEVDAAIGTTIDTASPADIKSTAPVTGAVGGLWVTDAEGKAVGVMVQRGHATLSIGATVDVLRDGALVWSPQYGIFFGVQMSTGQVIHPRLGVTDSSCAEPITAGYYTDGDAISGQSFAFVYNGSWYRIEDYKPLQLVACGGTVPDGAPGKCSPHNGSCRGFGVKKMLTGPPLQFAAPLQFSWVAK
ncbi:MAG: hypothetical protein EXR77_01690 [Myxococcales bacterium]|nr:hypothetical protein [Myxococcales bacterium]